MELDKIIQNILEEFKEDEVLEGIVREQLEKTVAGTVKDLLSPYSDFGKKLKDQIQKEMEVNLKTLSLPEYSTMVLNWVKEIIQGNVNEVARAQIEETLEKFLKPIKKKEWKLSEIIDEFKASFTEGECEGDRYGTAISFHCERSLHTFIDTESYHIYFDECEDKEQYQCNHNMFISEGRILSVKSSGGDITKSKYKNFYGFDSFLFQLYSAKVTIEVNKDDVDTHFGDW